uniref:ras and Rab interactor 2-like n=1 Tax=Doryrhamphus excisus TaxID=161450 RepID=UPI0025AE62B8|nr:ras and Rab interactor 2-like [Doryrhamphus excisus]XP_057942502.1 ras and Rab interactor 2-like [Doryrhamphus excisus]XP_057942503.1 ras and Rab interactor 2-like [Doryrhamphus excisus]
MAQQEEPLYDFPEPTQTSECKFSGHQRACGSLRSISVLDRLLLTVPVWLQLSINPATALHILQREPPGTFLVRKSRTSKRNVLCVRLVDESVPSFVQQFGIRDEHSTLSLETSAISFPDLPRLISFYCVSRDVLPFPLELPEAIARATSHKELESISHMGVEFWSSHLNVRGPREAPKTQKNKEMTPDSPVSAPPTANSQTIPTSQLNSAPQPDTELKTIPESDPNSALFREFCPIETRSPRELDCGSGLGALCFINPLFLQSHSTLSKRRMMKRSFKVRVSTETSTLLSPPLAPPPPPPLMPKTKAKCKALKQTGSQNIIQNSPEEAQEQGQTLMEAAQLPIVANHPPDDTDYMQPPPAITSCISPSLSPYLAPPLPPKMSSSLQNPSGTSSATDYQFPSLSPQAPSASLSPYESPSSSPFSLSPFFSPTLSQLAETRQKSPDSTGTPKQSLEMVSKVEINESDQMEELPKEMEAATVDDTSSCSSFDSRREAAETPRQTAVQPSNDTVNVTGGINYTQ